MEILGIKFAPLNVPLERRLQSLGVIVSILLIYLGGVTGALVALYLSLFTRLWWLTLIYCAWILIIDKKTPETGGRRIEWLKTWRIWKYHRDYFPVKVKKLPSTELDANKNYLLCYFPHGIFTFGIGPPFSVPCDFQKLCPNHKPHILTLSIVFQLPFFRDLALGLGLCSVSANSINYLLNKQDGGNVAVLVVGGAAEVHNCEPGRNKIVLKRRKGFVKLALKNGASLIPAYGFGETDVYSLPRFSEGSILKKVQQAFQKIIGVPLIIPLGRGIFQYSFGVLPHRKPITTVLGKPIDVPKIENPTQEQVEEYHQKFMDELNKLFEEQKYHYLENPEEQHLEID